MPPPEKHILLLLVVCMCGGFTHAQTQDTGAVKKRSLVGSIFYGIRTSFGKDTTGRRESVTVLNTEALLPYEGKIIRSITTEQLGFEKSISETAGNFIYFGTRVLNAVHATSRDRTILRNIYLKEGTAFNPYLAADNERHLRTIGFIQDSRIIVNTATSTADSIDIVVITKDLFAYSPYIGGISPLRQRVGLSNINLLGTGQKVSSMPAIAIITYEARSSMPALILGRSPAISTIAGKMKRTSCCSWKNRWYHNINDWREASS
jgi:hypothetical protein